MYQHLQMSATPLVRERPDVRPAIAAVVARAIRRRPEQRYPTAAELLDALRYPEGADLAVLGEPDPPLGAPVRESLIRHPLVLLGAVALGTAALVLIAEILLRR
jgi:serine/threonine-protein kinase